MKLKIIAAALATAALPVLAQTATAPTDSRQARVEVSDPAGHTDAASRKAAKPAKTKPAKTARKSSKKKAKKKPQSVG